MHIRTDGESRHVFRALLKRCGLVYQSASVLAACALAAAMVTTALTAIDAAAATTEDLYRPIGQVVSSPRCTNCHGVESPRQGEERRRHDQMVMRGKDGFGAPTIRCATCHQATNTGDGIVPGAKGWHMPPVSMQWQAMNAKEICNVMTNPAKNGNRKTPREIIEHMETDPLVLWAWKPGADRKPPPVPQDEFVLALRAWAVAGTPCPR